VDSASEGRIGGHVFLAGGHWYGAPENIHSVFPASSFLSAIPRIEDLSPDWIFALGDLVRNAGDTVQVRNLRRTLLCIPQPTILVAGNHDLLPDGSLPPALSGHLPRVYGQSQSGAVRAVGEFTADSSLFLLLPTERLRQPGGSRDLMRQLDSIRETRPAHKSVLVFSHRLLWALAEPGFGEMDDFANEPFGPLVDIDSAKMVYQSILNIVGDQKMYWFSGDIGASWSFTVFEGHSDDGRRHFYAAGLGDRPEDALWQVEVDRSGWVYPQVFWLADPPPMLGGVFDLDFWRAEMRRRQEVATRSFSARMKDFVQANGTGFLMGFFVGMAILVAWRRFFPRRARRFPA
jgi:3',5'-cyclic AMP phosphodiesterase CpdA